MKATLQRAIMVKDSVDSCARGERPNETRILQTEAEDSRIGSSSTSFEGPDDRVCPTYVAWRSHRKMKQSMCARSRVNLSYRETIDPLLFQPRDKGITKIMMVWYY